MSTALDFQALIKQINISDIYVRKTSSEFLVDYNPKYIDLSEFSNEVKFFTNDVRVIESVEGSILQVFVEAGHRFTIQEGDEAKVVAFVEADFIAEYLLKEQIDPEFISGFADQFVSIHVWPFWREFLSNQSIRLNLPCPILPLR